MSSSSGAGGAPPSTNPNRSIESARRFLYDEDEDPGFVAPTEYNTPLPHPRDIKAHEPKRLNPIVAACLATCSTCRGIGMKSFLVAVGVILVLFLLISGIVSIVESREPVNQSRLEVITNQILSAKLTSPDLLVKDSNSPQYHALQWISNIDTSVSENSPYVLQRYALAVFFYSMSRGDYSHVKPVAGWTRQDQWMSPTMGMCNWFGVKCEFADNGPTFDGDEDVTALILMENNIKGDQLPSELTALTALITFDLSQNKEIAGTLPSEFSKLTNLRTLTLTGNELKGTIPNTYGDFSNLRALYLGENKLAGTIPLRLNDIVTLQALGLSSNHFEGTIPDFEDNIKLAFIYLDQNKFTGLLPTSLSKLTNLVAFDVSFNHITGTIPHEFESLRRLQKLNLNDNNLHGTLPDIFGRTTRLVDLHLENNSFEGGLPESLGRLKDIQSFRIANNKFSGTFPRLLATMADLETLSFEKNRIGGTLPYLIATMKNLKRFLASENQLSGPIPTEIGDLHHLETLHLDHNQLTGSVPTQLGYLRELQVLRLNGNNLTGSVPEEICLLVDEEELDTLWVDCEAGGKVECNCCTCAH